ncbi:OsmC family peroxiredoxin [Rhodanobacter sp. DHB23]|uniref:OsmC family peroxiredoxin n=1 Tax=Rhodanobacter sp. DHB23 TaxID=2775923 RepID=UPI00177FBCAA|nr:OsmC family peroxiredoxin [Rhodanobacter sp. DHB23]MBD8873678.1 OsmC family peroxiredoxin [Rhodanobacter sp. DHB23]
MKIERHGSAIWYGDFAQGCGSLSTESAALDDHYYCAASRFDRHCGSNPEELLATAHAGCFNMTLSKVLADAHLKATQLLTSATVTLEQHDARFTITAVHLSLRAVVPNTDPIDFRRLVAMARAKCPLTRLLNAEVTLDTSLQGEWGTPATAAAMASV